MDITASIATDPAPPAASLVEMARVGWRRPELRLTILGLLGCVGLLALVFWPTLRHFAYVWSTDENYSHGFLVPLISLYFANEAARRGPIRVRAGVTLGLGLLVLSILGRLATILVPVGIVGDGAFLLGLAGLCGLLFGTEALRRYWFALFFLIFMIPLPVALYARIASPLQLMASQVASGVLNAIGIPVLREGNLMTLPGDLRMFVAEACSGIRQLTGFLALTTAVAYLTARPLWYRGVVVLSSIPIALTANVVRVTVTGVIMYRLDPQFASGTFHTFEGLLMMAFGLAMLGAECWILNRVSGRRPAHTDRLTVGLVERQSTLQSA
jgi:exosortase